MLFHIFIYADMMLLYLEKRKWNQVDGVLYELTSL